MTRMQEAVPSSPWLLINTLKVMELFIPFPRRGYHFTSSVSTRAESERGPDRFSQRCVDIVTRSMNKVQFLSSSEE